MAAIATAVSATGLVDTKRPTRQMHLGVFVLGTGDHSAGWRYEGAAVSNNDLSVTHLCRRKTSRKASIRAWNKGQLRRASVR
jgi:hypothetical protein